MDSCPPLPPFPFLPPPQRSPRDGHTFNEDEDEVLGVLSLHPDEVAAFSSSAGNRSMWGSMFRMLDRGAMTTPAATTAEEEEEGKEEKEGEKRNEDESQDQQEGEQQQPAAPAEAESVPAPAAEASSGEGEKVKEEGEGKTDGGWWQRVSSLLMTHFRAILKTLSDPSSCCSSGSGYSLQDELRLSCPYLRRQPRQRVLLITLVVPVAVVVGVTAAVVLVGVCASGSSSSSSSPSTKRGGRDSCLATSSSFGASSGTAKAPLFRVL